MSSQQLQSELFQDMVVTIPASEVGPELTFQTERTVGSGSFGVVFKAVTEDGDTLAVKKVFQDRRYRNRELKIIIDLDPHAFIVKTRNYYYSVANNQSNGNYLNLVMEYYPENAYQVYRSFARHGKKMSLADVKLYTYQFLRGLAYMHVFSIANRDLKPQNTLINRQTGHAVLCDLGSAKTLDPSEPNIAYICSRYYRAPELVFGSRFYTTKIDIWSFACVVAEMIIGRPLFPGQSPIDQLVEIIKVLGPPTQHELRAMNPQLREYKFPTIQVTPIGQVLQTEDQTTVDFFVHVLKYDPTQRYSAFQALAHGFYDDVRRAGDPGKLGLFVFNEKEKEVILKEIGEDGLRKLLNQ